ncbi:protein-tyrosine phosphatase family protein [Methylibium sp.]|uniref:protein-tyrosine phosphatase family protein n=1 Tax=Methylibium sp. TaxID=2067992 RepID=UPI003D0A9A82
MSFRALPLPPGVAGRLWLAPMPGRLAPWPEFVAEARAAGLTRIVCLTPRDEIAELSPHYLAAIEAHTLPCGWQAIPMRNFGVARELQTFKDGIEALATALGAGEVLLLHCAAGIGRTGTAGACLLKRLGLSADEALQRVQAAGSNPESARQSGWIEAF